LEEKMIVKTGDAEILKVIEDDEIDDEDTEKALREAKEEVESINKKGEQEKKYN
jgi:F0F1-type ATP synthase epsilon subunit